MNLSIWMLFVQCCLIWTKLCKMIQKPNWTALDFKNYPKTENNNADWSNKLYF